MACAQIRHLTIARSNRWYTIPPVHEFKKYDPKVVESDWYEWWQQRGLFQPKKARGADFTMLLPPPNVTGVLHIGHALTLSIQDAIARWQRMHGRNVNWVPGTDHAGISMQTVVEKKLMRESGQSRHDLGREALVQKVWEWKAKHGDRIKQQTTRIGASLNWDQEYFTMDQKHSQIVQDAFIRLYEERLIYRAIKMVSWSCALQSVISDIEVDRIPTQGRTLIEVAGSTRKVEFGVLHSVAFPIVDPPANGPFSVLVETTRPETMLGDVALAINSQDIRYRRLKGKRVVHPLLGKELPIVSDDILVDASFGTGVVKVTPAHDADDYACAQRNQLPVVSVFSQAGTVVGNPLFGDFVGATRWEVRRKVVDRLMAAGAYMGGRDAGSSVISKCSRSGDIIEPMLVPQWYVRCKQLGQMADDLVQKNAVKLVPERQKTIWHNWLSNIEDWCVSRQLWWGHRIPMYRVSWKDGSSEREMWVAAKNEEQAWEKAKDKLSQKEQSAGASNNSRCQFQIVQDVDVLDTWFSSALLPLLAFKPSQLESAEGLSSVLETGQDILFFWVARMAMLCTYFTKIPPFATVLLHPMVRDAQGRKMSKSLGNIIDPMDVIDGASLAKLQDTLRQGNLSKQETRAGIRELSKLYPNGFQKFGADSLRLTLLLYTKQTQQINMSLDSVKTSYHFCNKLWNTFKFIHMHAEQKGVPWKPLQEIVRSSSNSRQQLNIFDRALVSRLGQMLATYHKAMRTYKLGAAAEAVREFVQRDLCDRYIEVSKLALFGNPDATRQDPAVAVGIMRSVLDIVLRALHPFMPFLSEELWQRQRLIAAADTTQFGGVHCKDMSIMECEWDTSSFLWIDSQAEAEADIVFGVVSAIRSIRQQYDRQIVAATSETAAAAAAAVFTVEHAGTREKDWHLQCIKLMSKEEAVCICTRKTDDTMAEGEKKATVVVSPLVRVSAHVRDIEDKIDYQAVGKMQKELEKLHLMTENESYQKNAPETVKEDNRKRMSMLRVKLAAATATITKV